MYCIVRIYCEENPGDGDMAGANQLEYSLKQASRIGLLTGYSDSEAGRQAGGQAGIFSIFQMSFSCIPDLATGT
jgi:hypothetical protein